MTPTPTPPTPADLLEHLEALDDALLAQFDDAALERALRTVHCRPEDVSQYLRASAGR